MCFDCSLKFFGAALPQEEPSRWRKTLLKQHNTDRILAPTAVFAVYTTL